MSFIDQWHKAIWTKVQEYGYELERSNQLERCAISGANGCHECELMYKHRCLVKYNGDLDYLKALVDLDEEFPSVKLLT